MAEPKSLIERIGDALKGEAEEKKEAVSEAVEQKAKTVEAKVEEVKEVAAKKADNLQEQLSDVRKMLTEKERELTQKTGLLAQNERVLAAKEKALAEKDKEIETLKATLKQAQDETVSLREQLANAARAIPAAAEAVRTYTVKPGDSLSAIAKALYGNAARWPEIFEANKDKIKEPSLIRPGQVLRIP